MMLRAESRGRRRAQAIEPLKQRPDGTNAILHHLPSQHPTS